MASDRVVRVSYRHKPGFLERVGQSLAGSAAGFALFIISFCVLYYNEGRSVEIANLLDEGLRTVVPIRDGAESYDMITMNKLVHIAGPLQSGVLADPNYPVAVPCVRLSRKVEMYQWVEHSESNEFEGTDEIRTETTYSYTTEWSPSLHQSRHFAEEFGHQNPTEIPVAEANLVSSKVVVSGMELSTSAVDRINWLQDMIKLSDPPSNMDIKLHGKYYYHAKNPLVPEVGDVRVFFQYAGIAGETRIGPRDEVSLVAKNVGGRLIPYQKDGRNIEFVHRGIKSPQEVFQIEQSANSATTWLLRLVGWIMMFVGLSLMTSVVRTLVDWIPIVRNIVSASVFMFNITLSLFLSLITIAIGWFWARPLLSATVAVASLLPWYFSGKRADSIHAYRR